jgi:uncharacterized repeat protein (TIGR03803 family)
LVRDAAGNLYGTTADGGDPNCGCGTVFKLDTSGKETVLHAFTGMQDGGFPNGLVQDTAGNLYATTEVGGDPNCASGNGCGTVFKLDPMTGTETVLYAFKGAPDGDGPLAGVIRDAAGNLYGTTRNGGNTCFGSETCGTVFKVDTTGKETVLHAFTSRAGGEQPSTGLIEDSQGNLYGAIGGGVDRGCGMIYELTP